MGNLAVQEQADIAGDPDLYSRYLSLKAKFDNGVQFSDKDRAQLIDFARTIKTGAEGRLKSYVDQRALAEKGISGYDVSKVASALQMTPESDEPMVKVVYKNRIKTIPVSLFPEAVRVHKAKLYKEKY